MPHDVTKEEYIEAYNTLERIEGANSWWKGDLAGYYKQEYGDLVQLAEEYGWDYGNLRVCKYVAGRYELLVRTNNLSFKHHQIVAPLEDRLEWLQRAAAKRGK